MRIRYDFAVAMLLASVANVLARGAEPVVQKIVSQPLIYIKTYEPFLSATDKQLGMGVSARSHWTLCVFKESLRFTADGCTRLPGTDAPDFPNTTDGFRLFAKDGVRLRLYITDDKQSLKDQAIKQGWYVSGDYSTDPPSVTLTQEPTKYSSWKFVDDTADDNGHICFIKNENDLNKDEWLYFEDKGIVYKNGAEHRKPILSPDKKVLFFLEKPSK